MVQWRMMPLLRHWWGRPPASPEAPVVTSLPTAIVPEPPVPPAPKKIARSGLELFLAATDALAREKVLKEHPFWQAKEVELQLDGHQVAAVIEHICDLHSKFAWRLSHAHMDYDDDEEKIEAMRGVQWGQRDAYRFWHQRALALLQDHPEHRGILLSAMQHHVKVTSDSNDVEWLDEAEDLLRLGCSVSMRDILNGWLKKAQFQKFEGMPAAFNAYPLMTTEFQKVENDAEALEWVKENYKRALLLSSFHQRLDCWQLAEHIPKKELILMLAEQANDGALLKAWHGIPLTGEETLRHPLAYSLYVHKHAHIYLEEAQPLPDAWSMALSLATTGVDFQEMLLAAAQLKMNPEKKPEMWALPNLES